jgi:hypothetical protein
MRYIEAPDPIELTDQPTLFIAGGITGVNWQSEMVRALTKANVNLTVLNPRRRAYPEGDPDAPRKQIEWEWDALRKSNAVSFWFSPETLCPITLFELGKQLVRPNIELFVGSHPGYARRLDLQVQIGLERPELDLVASVDALAEKVIRWSRLEREF